MTLNLAAIQLLADFVNAGCVQALALSRNLSQEEAFDALVELNATDPDVWLSIDDKHRAIEPTGAARRLVTDLRRSLREFENLGPPHWVRS
ncbi:hypothetical protein GCM10025776_30060 [Corallincola platygyrae]